MSKRDREYRGLVITIDTGNAAFADEGEAAAAAAYARGIECARILRALADRIEEGSESGGSLLDINGNRVGRFTFQE